MRQYYVPQVTELSEQELKTVFETVEPPVCLLGGWAVHLHVNSGFQSEHGRAYIGSRDIDIGVHVDENWSGDTLSATPVGATYCREENTPAEGFRCLRVSGYGTRLKERLEELDLEEDETCSTEEMRELLDR